MTSPPGIEALRNTQYSSRRNDEAIERPVRHDIGSLIARMRTIESSVARQGRKDKLSEVRERLGALEYSTCNSLPAIPVLLDSLQQRLGGLEADAQRHRQNTQTLEE